MVFIPEPQLDAVKEAMFEAGAGRQGNYRRCAWQVKGLGQFEAMPGADPHCGELGRLHTEPEWRVELLCPPDCLNQVLVAMIEAHPYEEPAFDIFERVDPPRLPMPGA